MKCLNTANAKLVAWERLARSLGQGYAFGLYDYLNDLDARQYLHEELQHPGDRPDAALLKRLARADALVLGATERTETCLWGATNSRENDWHADDNWWYYALPKQRGAEFNATLHPDS